MFRMSQRLDAHATAMGSKVDFGPGLSITCCLRPGRRKLRQVAARLSCAARAAVCHWRGLRAHSGVSLRDVGAALNARMHEDAAMHPVLQSLIAGKWPQQRLLAHEFIVMEYQR